MVLDVDAPRGRVSLSLRQTRPDPLKQTLASILVPPDGSSNVRTPAATFAITAAALRFEAPHILSRYLDT